MEQESYSASGTNPNSTDLHLLTGELRTIIFKAVIGRCVGIAVILLFSLLFVSLVMFCTSVIGASPLSLSVLSWLWLVLSSVQGIAHNSFCSAGWVIWDISDSLRHESFSISLEIAGGFSDKVVWVGFCRLLEHGTHCSMFFWLLIFTSRN